MFIEKEDLGNVIYDYQLDQITDGDDNIVAQGIAAAVEEAKSYLTPNLNDKRRIQDLNATRSVINLIFKFSFFDLIFLISE